MSFNEPAFLFLFLPALLAIFHLLPRCGRTGAAARDVLLLAASLLFYAWGGKQFIGVLLGATLVNYALGLALERRRTTAGGRWLLALGVAGNLGLLIAFKYSRFLVGNLNELLALAKAAAIPMPELLVPLGLSFFTFHAIGYLVEVHSGRAPAQRNPVGLALFFLFFPKVVAGPISRYAPAGRETDAAPSASSVELFAWGVRRFAVGLVKKVVISSAFAGPADAIFALGGGELTAALAWLGIACYTLQIYFDFSGYTDMAIGVAALFGRRLPENFDYPYISQSIREFWRRWHMSLSSWLRDYLYIPLGGGRGSPLRVYANLVIVFLLCGLWHGAAWSFVVWGAYHGLFLVLERLGLGAMIDAAWRPLRHAYALLVVMVGWVFFRADNLGHALTFLGAMAGLNATPDAAHAPNAPGAYLTGLFLATSAIALVAATPVLPAMRAWRDRMLARASTPESPQAAGGLGAAWAALDVVCIAALLLIAGLFIAASTYSPFIYRQF